MSKKLLEKYGLRPKKSLGQNFLADQNVLRKIVESADLKKNDHIIEIGPGLGVLTKELAKNSLKVDAIEKDSKLIQILESELSEFDNVKIINEDALKFNPPSKKYKVVANIPYYITSPLISHFLNSKNRPASMVLLIQKEVAEKITAKEGKLNVLALHVQVFGKPKIIAKVSKNAFNPPPKVESAILKIEIFEKPLAENPDKFFKVVHAGFSHKRKTILNSLSKGLKLDVEIIADALEQSKIDPKMRAEKITISKWNTLVNYLHIRL